MAQSVLALVPVRVLVLVLTMMLALLLKTTFAGMPA
jgi:hypothetical protein